MSASPLRFFLAIGIPSKASILGFAVLVLVSLRMLWLDPSSAPGALMMLLLVQMFACATGFVPQARRGHYDPVLIAYPRWRVAVDHWIASIAPGAIAWAMVGCLECAAAGGWPFAFTAPALVAFVLVSSLAWAATTPAAHGTAGVLWMIAISVLLITRTGFEMLLTARTLTPLGPDAVARAALASVVCPFALLSERPMPGPVVAACGAVAVVAWVCGVALVVTRDYPLQV